MRIIELTEEARTNILENLLKRSPNSYGEFEGRVNEIIENVRANRDAAIFDYTKRFDGAGINAENILVTDKLPFRPVHTPTFSKAVTFCPKIMPDSSESNQEYWRCFS